MQIDTRHPAEKYLSDFEAPFIAAEPAFWKIIDGAFRHLSQEPERRAYVSMEGMAQEIAPHDHVIQAILSHPSIEHGLNPPDVSQRTPAWQKAVHDLGRKIAAMGAYRSARQIAHVEPALEKQLLEHDLPLDAPASLLKNLPAWGIYLEYGQMTKEKLGEYAAEGAFLSLYAEENDLMLDVIPIGAPPGHLPRLLISLRNDIKLSHFMANMSNNPAGPFLKLVCITALHLSAGELSYQNQNRLHNPSGDIAAGTAEDTAPQEPMHCRISAAEQVHAAARAIKFVDRARPPQSTPQP